MYNYDPTVFVTDASLTETRLSLCLAREVGIFVIGHQSKYVMSKWS